MRIEYRLLDRAVRYALSAAGRATPELLPVATPCADWDLGRLLVHLGDSLDALAEGLAARSVGPAQACCGVEGSAGAPSTPGTGDRDGLIAALAGRAAVLLDSGVRRGTDALKYLALGAEAVLLGRLPLWGLVAGGEAGAEAVLRMVLREMDTAMAFLGAHRVPDLRDRRAREQLN